MHQPSVSIIVPVYNVAPYVEDCIRSVIRQTYDGKMECIIVDDCGTDDSMAIVERLVSEYNGSIEFKILHHTHNRGLSAARNTGMDVTTCDYLFFLDSDDELTDDCIEKLAEPIKREWYDLVVGNLKILGSEKKYSGLLLKLPNHTVLLGKDIINNYRTKWNMMAQNKLYKKTFLQKSCLSFLEGLIHEDELWSFQVACLSSSLYTVNDYTYIYRIRHDGIASLSNLDVRVNNYTIILKEMGPFTKRIGLYNEHIHKIIQGFFYKVQSYYLNDISKFKMSYKLLRPFIKPSITCLFIANNNHIKACFRDFHFYLPINIAPFWLYFYIKYHMK